MKRDSFIFYRSFFEATIPLNDNDKLDLFNTICEFALNQTETETEPMVKAMFTLIKPQLEANHKKYENGAKGGRPKTKPKPKDNQKITKPKPNDNVNDNVNDNDNINKPFSFTLTKLTAFENLSKEYCTQLQDYISGLGKNLSYKEFAETCVMKGYKYKNYKLAYNKWTKEESTTKEWK